MCLLQYHWISAQAYKRSSTQTMICSRQETLLAVWHCGGLLQESHILCVCVSYLLVFIKHAEGIEEREICSDTLKVFLRYVSVMVVVIVSKDRLYMQKNNTWIHKFSDLVAIFVHWYDLPYNQILLNKPLRKFGVTDIYLDIISPLYSKLELVLQNEKTFSGI